MRIGFSWIAMLLVVAGCSKAELPGGELYSANCANCHGRYADGEGPAAADMGPVPDLRYLAAQNGGVFPAARVTAVIDGREAIKAHGERRMPVWGNVFVELDGANNAKEARTTTKIKDVVDYLAAIQLKD